eukprot:623513-Rhodomonas_salina.1
MLDSASQSPAAVTVTLSARLPARHSLAARLSPLASASEFPPLAPVRAAAAPANRRAARSST